MRDYKNKSGVCTADDPKSQKKCVNFEACQKCNGECNVCNHCEMTGAIGMRSFSKCTEGVSDE